MAKKKPTITAPAKVAEGIPEAYHEWLSTLSQKEKEQALDRFERNPWLLYRPHPMQQKFHASKARVRFFFGGNRAGKTRALIQEVIWYAIGMFPEWHPKRGLLKPPNDIWVVSLDFPSSRDVVQPMIRKLLGSGYLKSWRETDKIIELTNGTQIAFKSVDSGWEKFQGTAKHLIAFDEEPSYNVYQECQMRIVSVKGDIICAMTPLHGMTWVYDEVYEPWLANRNEDIECFIAGTKENPYTPTGELDRIARTFHDEEKVARLEGKFVEFAGMIYKKFRPELHCIPRFSIPKDWVKIRGIDPGLNNPTAVVWWAISPHGEHYIYDEYYDTDKTIREFSTAIKTKTGMDQISHNIIDPSSGARNPAHPDLRSVREEYASNGIWCKMGNNNVSYGINCIKELLETNPGTGRPRLHIFDDLRHIKKEFMRYRWDSFRHHANEQNQKEKPKKVMDHLMDAMRYVGADKPSYVSEADSLEISKMHFKPTDS